MIKLHMSPLSQRLQLVNTINQPSSSLFERYGEIFKIVNELEALFGQVGHNLRIADCLKHKRTKQFFWLK